VECLQSTVPLIYIGMNGLAKKIFKLVKLSLNLQGLSADMSDLLANFGWQHFLLRTAVKGPGHCHFAGMGAAFSHDDAPTGVPPNAGHPRQDNLSSSRVPWRAGCCSRKRGHNARLRRGGSRGRLPDATPAWGP
jgi:hypothetical protein